jgi:2-amino-4-hydroxy-6-hydroxymethyldihydropteridine diphosphokinase
MVHTAFIGLGSNIEPRKKYLDEAIELLSEHNAINVQQTSSIYETAPVGYLDQGRFLNMVIQIETSLSSMNVLAICQEVELQLGRKRTVKNGPRTVDLDILLYNDENRESEKLTIPHPRMHERAFVLVPLYEIAPDLVISTKGEHVRDLLGNLLVEDVRGVEKWDGK